MTETYKHGDMRCFVTRSTPTPNISYMKRQYIKLLTMFFLKRDDVSQSSLIEGRSPWDERWLRKVLEF